MTEKFEKLAIRHFIDPTTNVVNTLILQRYKIQGQEYLSIETLEGKYMTLQEFEEAHEKQSKNPLTDTFNFIEMNIEDAKEFFKDLMLILKG